MVKKSKTNDQLHKSFFSSQTPSGLARPVAADQLRGTRRARRRVRRRAYPKVRPLKHSVIIHLNAVRSHSAGQRSTIADLGPIDCIWRPDPRFIVWRALLLQQCVARTPAPTISQGKFYLQVKRDRIPHAWLHPTRPVFPLPGYGNRPSHLNEL